MDRCDGRTKLWYKRKGHIYTVRVPACASLAQKKASRALPASCFSSLEYFAARRCTLLSYLLFSGFSSSAAIFTVLSSCCSFFPPRARYILDVSFFSALPCCPAYNARFTAGVLDYFVLLFLLQFIKLPVIVSFRHSTRKVHTLRPVAQTRPGILFPRYPCFLKEN